MYSRGDLNPTAKTETLTGSIIPTLDINPAVSGITGFPIGNGACMVGGGSTSNFSSPFVMYDNSDVLRFV